jgi:gluconolactonase
MNRTDPRHATIRGPRFSRRRLLATAAVTAGASRVAHGRDFGPGAEPVGYPDPDIVVLDKRFARIRLGNTPIRRLMTGCLWAEGPAWNTVGRYLVWSDIPNDCQMRWLEEDGHVSEFRKPAGYSNGNSFDREGRQLSCEHGNRRLVRYEHDGTVSVLADKFAGKPLNAPNDVVVDPEGNIWFTDPGYGSLMDYEGHRGQLELKEAIYRLDGKTGQLDKVADDIFKPNGLTFSPDYKKLYVADTGVTHYPNAPRVVKAWDVVDGKRLIRGRTFVSMALGGKAGFADGLDCDEQGNVWVAAGWVGRGYDGVHIFAPDGQRIGQIRLPEICSNVCFGGAKRNRLFMTASQSVYTVHVEVRGAHVAGA